ncbi:MAG: WD40 repeat domain-containing protein, partial [bacterium]
LNETAEAKRWLAAAPMKYRNWEWRYLSARSDNSIATIPISDTAPDEVHYSPDGKTLIAAMQDGTIRLYDAASLQESKRLTGHKNAVYVAKISADGARVVSCSRDSTIAVWNLANGNIEWQAKGGGYGFADVDFSPDGKTAAYCSWYLKNRRVVGIVSLWEVATGKEIWRTDFREKPILAIRFSPDGKRLAVGTWGWRVGVWNLEKKDEPPMELHFDDVPAYSAIDDIAFSPDGSKIAAATKNSTPRVWELESGKLLFELRGHQQPVFAIAFTNDGKRIYTGSADATLMMWDADTGKLVKKIYGHENGISSIALDPAGERFVTVSSDKTIRIWDSNFGLEFANKQGRSQYI